MTASTSTLTPEETTLPSTRSARKAVLPNRPKGTSTKPASVVSLNSISVTKSWIARMKKAEEHDHPGEQQHDDLDEVLEEGDIAHQAGDRIEDRPPGIDADLRDAAGPQKIGWRRAPVPPALRPSPAKALEDDLRELVPVADDVGEDKERVFLIAARSCPLPRAPPTSTLGASSERPRAICRNDPIHTSLVTRPLTSLSLPVTLLGWLPCH